MEAADESQSLVGHWLLTGIRTLSSPMLTKKSFSQLLWQQMSLRMVRPRSQLDCAHAYSDNVGLILLLPVYNVWKLQMRTRRKIAVINIFLLGGFTTITGIIRLHFLSYAFAALGEPLFADVACKLFRSLLLLFLLLTLDPD